MPAPCSGAIWLGKLADLASPGDLPPANRAQFAAFSITEFGGLYGPPGGIGCLTQPLLGERIEASLKPNRVVVITAGDTLNLLAERHGSTATIESWNASGYGPPYVKLGDLVRYTYEDVEAWLAQQFQGLRQRRGKNLLESRVAAVANPQPDHLGGRTLRVQQPYEVAVLGHHHRSCGAGPLEDHRIRRIPQADLPNRDSFQPKVLLIDPPGKQRRQLGIQPQLHPSSTGWSISRAA